MGMRVDAAEFIPAGQAQASRMMSAATPEFVPSAKGASAWWPSSDLAMLPKASGDNEGSTVGDRLEVPCLPAESGEKDECAAIPGTVYADLGFSDGILDAAYHPPHYSDDVHGLTDPGGGGPPGLLDALLTEATYTDVVDLETFLTPVALGSPLLEAASDEAGCVQEQDAQAEEVRGNLRVEGQRLHWELPGPWAELTQVPRGTSLISPRFSVAGVSSLRLALFPLGASLTAKGDCAVALLCEERAKLKFELFLNARSSGMKVMLGKKFSCDFRAPESGFAGDLQVSVQVHENLFYAGFR